MGMIDVIIPAAGLGKRLRPITLSIPKVLLPVADKPILGHILDRLKNLEIQEITIVIGYLGNQVVEYVMENYKGRKFRFVEQKDLLGLGHAVRLALKKKRTPVLIVLGDTIIDVDYKKIINKGENTIGVMEVENPRRFGVVEVNGRKIVDLVEKSENPPSNLAIAGVYYFKDQSLLKKGIDEIMKKGVKTKGEYQLTDAMRMLIEKGVDLWIEPIDACYDCGTREALLESNRVLLNKFKTAIYSFKDSIIIPPVYIHPDADVRKSIIGPYVSIGANTIIEYSIIKDSIIDKNSTAREAIIKESLIGNNSHIRGSSVILEVGGYPSMDLA